MDKKYFHELSDEEYKALIKSKITYDQLLKSYAQPDWCNYSVALEGIIGCWALIGREIKSETDCKECDCRKVTNE
ncbi:MAG: hypothetical protein ABFD50_20045 [Smithella sp.]